MKNLKILVVILTVSICFLKNSNAAEIEFINDTPSTLSVSFNYPASNPTDGGLPVFCGLPKSGYVSTVYPGEITALSSAFQITDIQNSSSNIVVNIKPQNGSGTISLTLIENPYYEGDSAYGATGASITPLGTTNTTPYSVSMYRLEKNNKFHDILINVTTNKTSAAPELDTAYIDVANQSGMCT